MVTILTVPKPFKGHIDTIQRNAIKSWLKLYPKCEIILFGDDESIAKAAEEFKNEALMIFTRDISKVETSTLQEAGFIKKDVKK